MDPQRPPRFPAAPASRGYAAPAWRSRKTLISQNFSKFHETACFYIYLSIFIYTSQQPLTFSHKMSEGASLKTIRRLSYRKAKFVPTASLIEPASVFGFSFSWRLVSTVQQFFGELKFFADIRQRRSILAGAVGIEILTIKTHCHGLCSMLTNFT